MVSFTGLAIVSTGVWETTDDAGVLTQAAFASELGTTGTNLVALAITCFAFSTLLGWSYFGERCMDRLFGRKAVVPYRVVFVIAIFGGAVGALELLWDIADVLNGMMALPNLVGLLILSGVVVRETRKYFASDAAQEV